MLVNKIVHLLVIYDSYELLLESHKRCWRLHLNCMVNEHLSQRGHRSSTLLIDIRPETVIGVEAALVPRRRDLSSSLTR